MLEGNTINKRSMWRYRKTLSSPFYSLCIHLGIVDLFNVAGKALLVTFAKRFYADFAYRYETVRC